MPENEKPAKNKPQRDQERAKLPALHIRHLQDRALPAGTVLRQVQNGSQPGVPSPLFVP